MTNQEAIETLKANYPDARYEQLREAVDTAISALEKQIPKEPDMVRNKHNENIWSLYCPSCGNYVGVLNNRLKRVDMYNRSNGNICPYCGQAIDWTEWEGE